MNYNDVEKLISDYVIKYQKNLYRLAYSYVKNEHDALDIIQDSIVKAISSKNTLKEPQYIKTWFYRIVVNTSLDFIRKQKKVVLSDEQFLSDFDFGTVDQYKDMDLQKALDDLPDNYRVIIVLRYFEDLKIEDVAEILNENVNTVKTRLYKALEKLRIKIDY